MRSARRLQARFLTSIVLGVAISGLPAWVNGYSSFIVRECQVKKKRCNLDAPPPIQPRCESGFILRAWRLLQFSEME
jgi:hypothetical protein